MKRTPLARKTPLKRGGWLKRKPKGKPAPHVQRAMWSFGKYDRYSACAKCGRTRLQAFLAGTKLTAHHVISKSKLRQIVSARGIDPVIVWDRRNRVWLCWSPCHEEHTNRKRPLTRHDLPGPAFAFAREIGLLHVLERDYR